MKVDGLTLDLIISSTRGKFRGRRKEIRGVSIDSRTIKPGEVFFAIKGENYDGHSFCRDALAKGASFVVVDKKMGLEDNYLLVDDTIKALGELAKRWRRRFRIKCIAITGTSGKTTTRRIIAHLLKEKNRCCESEKNFNNLIGLPLSVLRINKKTDIAVFEIAMNQPGEIKRLTSIAAPDIGVITNVGRGHLEFLGSIKNVAREKFELLLYLNSNGVAILNNDDRYVRGMAGKTKAAVFTFGANNGADFMVHNIQLQKEGSKFSVNGVDSFFIPLLGKINVYNALAAISVASFLGMGSGQMKRRLRTLKPQKLRLNRIVKKGIIIYNDSYNANPDSMAAAIFIVAREENRRKVACIGDMLELGTRSAEFHRKIGELLKENNFGVVLLFGDESANIARSLKDNDYGGIVLHFNDKQKLQNELIKTIRRGDVVLIKGSHANRLDTVADTLIKNIKSKK
jgi:UDP-N-acetylmuramoyl-tripeptide--D-alanyl-D-alanine ligase